MFTENDFWKLMSLVDIELVDREADYMAVEPIIEELSERSGEDIITFENLMASFLSIIDTEVNYKRSDHSSDGFLYQRCYVLAQGNEAYKAVLKSATKMPHQVSSCEALLHVAEEAWALSQEEKWTHRAPTSYETGSNEEGWPQQAAQA